MLPRIPCVILLLLSPTRKLGHRPLTTTVGRADDQGMEMHLAVNAAARQKAEIEGPTRKQITKARARYADLTVRAAAALEAGDDDLAFDLDSDRFDLECEFRPYGVEFTR